MSRLIIVLLAATAAFTTPATATSSPREDALVACLIGQASVYLHKQVGRKMSADAATEAAQAYAAKRCKGELPSEGAGDYVYYMIKAMTKTMYGDDDKAEDANSSQTREALGTKENPTIYIFASPPTSQVGLVLKGKYYWFHRVPTDEPCDYRFDGACYMKSDTKFVQVSKDIISIKGGKAFGCSPAIIPNTSKLPGYQSGYGKCTSNGWKSMPDSNPL
jgi:hypothetical protein